jgi:hypothetical protein
LIDEVRVYNRALSVAEIQTDLNKPITGAASNSPPAIALTSPADGSSYAAPASINLAASVTANGHTINKVQFYNGSSLLGEATASPYSYTWNNVAAGNYSLTARLMYDSSSAFNSSAANMTVASGRPPPPPPLTFAADSGTITAPFVALNGTISQAVETGVTTGGRAAYNFTISIPGDYIISTVVNAPNEGANSFYVNIDSEPTDPTMIWDIPVTTGFTNRIVSWRGKATASNSQYVPIVFTLSAGTHQLIVRGREANAQLKTITLSLAPKLKMNVSPNKLALGGQQYVLTGTGQPNTTYQIQSSTNLTTWTVLSTAATDSNGTFQFTDPTGTYRRNCWYRMQGAMP